MKNFPKNIASNGLMLRLLKPDDAPALHTLTNDPKIAEIISFLSYPVPKTFAPEWIAKNAGEDDRIYGAFVDDDMAGMIGIHKGEAGGYEIGYWVGTEFTGNGLATRMVTALTRTSRLYAPDIEVFAECLPENAGSWRVLIKNGFVDSGQAGKREGRQRLVLR